MSQVAPLTRVLLVEDDEDDFILVRHILVQSEYALTWCSSAEAAREHLDGHLYDLVLLDHGLPDTNSLAFLEEIRRALPSVPVIVLTGRDDRALAISAVKRGAANYILKDEIRLHLLPAIREARGEPRGPRLIRAERGHAALPFAETAERIYRILLETMNEGFLVVDSSGIVTFNNKALDAFVGCDPDQLLGRDVLVLFDEVTRTRLGRALGLVDERAPDARWTMEGTLLDSEGGPLPVLISGRALLDSVGRHEACLMTLTDVSELVRSRAELLDVNAKLRDLDQLKSHLLSMVSHDLRTPLSSVILATEHMMDGLAGPISDPQRELLDVIQRNSSRLWRLVKNLLDLSRIEAGALVLDLARMDLRELIQSQIGEMNALTATSEVRLRGDLPDRPVEAVVDADRLTQAVTNLLSNAIRFAQKEVLIRLVVQTSEIHIVVEDDGPGIPEQELPRVFDRFTRVSAHGSKSGTGLGLSIARALVGAHGGWVRAENRSSGDSPGPTGARFILSLPREGHA